MFPDIFKNLFIARSNISGNAVYNIIDFKWYLVNNKVSVIV